MGQDEGKDAAGSFEESRHPRGEGGKFGSGGGGSAAPAAKAAPKTGYDPNAPRVKGIAPGWILPGTSVSRPPPMKDEFYNSGQEAANTGRGSEDNPHSASPGTHQHEAWQRGHADAMNAKGRDPSSPANQAKQRESARKENLETAERHEASAKTETDPKKKGWYEKWAKQARAAAAGEPAKTFDAHPSTAAPGGASPSSSPSGGAKWPGRVM